MNYLRFTQYAYLIAAVLVAVESFNQFHAGNTGNGVIMALFTALGIFMFFFKRKFARKFDHHNKKP